MAKDRMILGNGENCIFTTDSEVTGLNNNVLVVGASGSGKTMSVSEACLLETYHSSLLISITKKRIAAKYSPVLLERGMEVFNLDFVYPSSGDIGYDPLDYIDFIIGLFFTTKSLLMFGKPVFRRDRHLREKTVSTILVILDTNRSSIVLLSLVRGFQYMRSIGNMKWLLSVLLLVPIATEVATHTFFFTYADKSGDKRTRQMAIIFEGGSIFLLVGIYMLFCSIH